MPTVTNAMLSRALGVAVPFKPAGRVTSTPWGRPDHHKQIAPGIDFYSTPSHGGIRLSDERFVALPEPIAAVGTFCGSPEWFEEDEDANLCALAFPSDFEARSVWHAVDWLRSLIERTDNPGPNPYTSQRSAVLVAHLRHYLTATRVGIEAAAIADKYRADNADRFRLGSWGSGRNGGVSLSALSIDGRRRLSAWGANARFPADHFKPEDLAAYGYTDVDIEEAADVSA